MRCLDFAKLARVYFVTNLGRTKVYGEQLMLCFCFNKTLTPFPLPTNTLRIQIILKQSWADWGHLGAICNRKVSIRLVAQLPFFWRLLCGDLEALGTSLQVPPPRSEVYPLLKMYHRVTRETTLAVGHDS